VSTGAVIAVVAVACFLIAVFGTMGRQ